jgi:carbon-monoxide dehydrogenase small subunit
VSECELSFTRARESTLEREVFSARGWGPARDKKMIFTLNGKRARVSAHPLKRLLDVLREDCGMTGTKEGCGEGECGACTVIVDGLPVNSCLVPIAHAVGTTVTTIEGLNGRHPLQRAFVEQGGAQCGICTPGMIMAAVAHGPHPSIAEMRVGLAGNLCRCTGYSAIYKSIRNSDGNRRRARPSPERESPGSSAARAALAGVGSPRDSKKSSAMGKRRTPGAIKKVR